MVLNPNHGSKMETSSLLRSGGNELRFGPNVKYFNVLRLYVGISEHSRAQQRRMEMLLSNLQ